MKELHDGTFVEDDVPTKNTGKGRYLLTPEEIEALEEQPPLDKPAILAAYRYEQETGGITVNGVSVRTDRETQAMLLAARTAAKEDGNYSVTWKAQNGFFTLSAGQIIGIADAVHAHVQGCFTAESAVDLDECDTEQEIRDAFDAAMQ